MSIEAFFSKNPYRLASEEKKKRLTKILNELTRHHQTQCVEYDRIIRALEIRDNASGLEQLPFLPVSLFKTMELKSVSSQEVIKILSSSGTTSALVSKIFLDRRTSALQIKALSSIIQSFIGPKRLPMVVVDHAKTAGQKASYSARGAGIIGLSFMGRNHFYLLDENMGLDFEKFHSFLKQFENESILFFGFTFMIWTYFYQECVRNRLKLNLKNSILIHSGGWKKMIDKAVSPDIFKQSVREQLGIKKIHNFYGMVEQVGSIFMECECGYLHAPDYADVIIRDPITLESLPNRQQGVIQVLSILPCSYPGHSLLTEDLGTIIGEDSCRCGRKGKYFTVEGRLPRAEIRGCSDTHASVREVSNGVVIAETRTFS